MRFLGKECFLPLLSYAIPPPRKNIETGFRPANRKHATEIRFAFSAIIKMMMPAWQVNKNLFSCSHKSAKRKVRIGSINKNDKINANSLPHLQNKHSRRVRP